MSVEGTWFEGVGVWCGVVWGGMCVWLRDISVTPVLSTEGGGVNALGHHPASAHHPEPRLGVWGGVGGLGDDGLTLVYLNYQVKARAAT